MDRAQLGVAVRAKIFDNPTGEISGVDVVDSILLAYDTAIANCTGGVVVPPPVVYDAHILGSSLGGEITLSPFHKFDGITEETRNAGVDFMDGATYLVHPMYQEGMSAIHMLDGAHMFLAKDFADQSHQTPHPEVLINFGTIGVSGNSFIGSQMKTVIAAGQNLEIHYDKTAHELYVEIV